MKEFWLDKQHCTGCSACSDICPKHNISMEVDECGFKYPKIHADCIDCNLCERVCNNRTNVKLLRSTKPSTYAAWSNDEETRFNSTSGGLFSELANSVLMRNGIIVGAAYNTANLVEHIEVNNNKDLWKIRQSKYIQSDTSGIYLSVKKALRNNKLVLFCGSPCQIAALYAFLGTEYTNLVTVDFICRGMNSPKAYTAWLSEIENSEGSNVTRVWFKYKEGGWKSSPKRTRIDFEDGHWIVKSGEENLFMHGYLTSNLYIRPSCGNCEFKGVPRNSDITLADFWKIDPSLDDDKGTSLVLVNSEKGRELFESINMSIQFYKRDFAEIFDGNVCFTDSVMIPKKSQAFLKELDSNSFNVTLKRYTKVPFFKKIRRFLGRIIRKICK